MVKKYFCNTPIWNCDLKRVYGSHGRLTATKAIVVNLSKISCTFCFSRTRVLKPGASVILFVNNKIPGSKLSACYFFGADQGFFCLQNVSNRKHFQKTIC